MNLKTLLRHYFSVEYPMPYLPNFKCSNFSNHGNKERGKNGENNLVDSSVVVAWSDLSTQVHYKALGSSKI